jgi:F-type H+-transporting ATPase subunit b
VKRATLVLIALAFLAGAALSATVTPAPDQPAAAEPHAASQPTPGEHAPPAAEPHRQPAEHGAAGQDHEAGAEGGHEAESPWATVARLFNFALLAGTLVYVLRSPFAAFLENRRVQIRKDLTDAAATREQAASQLTAIDTKLKALPSELESLKQRGVAEIAAEEQRIREAAEIERRRLLENGQREIERRTQLAERRLVRRTGELAVAVATERVKTVITDADQQRLLDRYLEQVRPEPIGS